MKMVPVLNSKPKIIPLYGYSWKRADHLEERIEIRYGNENVCEKMIHSMQPLRS